MAENTLDMELKSFDYSVFSSVRESLLQELLKAHRRDNAGTFTSLAQRLREKRLADEELDYAAAAGNSNMYPATDMHGCPVPPIQKR